VGGGDDRRPVSVLRAIRNFPPHGWLAFGLQLLLLFAVDAVYEVTRALLEGPADVAVAHARDIVRAERALGFFVERDLQRAVLDGPQVFESLFRWIYQNCQRLIVWTFVIWLYLRRNAFYPHVRNTIIALDVIGLVGYWLYPTAPPRLTPGYGIVDVIDPTQANLRSSMVGSLTNLYAAVPSLHTAYALLIGITGYRACRHLVTKLFWAVYPVLVVLATVVTGNHWLLDAAAGALALALAWTAVTVLPRAAARRVARPGPDARSAPAPPG
jgi:membrane-associated phospholipid phosphatase